MGIPSDFGSLFFLAFCGIMTVLVGIFSFLAYSIRDDFREMGRNLHGLAISLTSLTTRLESLDARLEKIEKTSDN